MHMSSASSKKSNRRPAFSCLRLDFAVVQGLDYYNGLFFQGFVNGLPRPVLSGGRYDNLLEKLGKPSRWTRI